MTVNERIKAVIKSSRKSVKNFAIDINIPKGTIDGVVGTRKSVPSFTLLNALLVHLPNLNPAWLMLGEGEMWEDEKKKIGENAKIGYSTQVDLVNRVGELEKQMAQYAPIFDSLGKNVGRLNAWLADLEGE